MHVGVIGRVALQIAGKDGAAPGALQLEPIDHRRIGHQRHVLGKTILKHARHQRALRIHGRLPLHQRGHRHHFVYIPRQPHLSCGLPEALHHRHRNLLWRGLRRKMVRIRKQVPFQALRRRIEIRYQRGLPPRLGQKLLLRTKTGLFEPQRDVEHAGAFGHRDRLGIHIAACNPLVNLLDGRRMVEAVLAGTQRAPSPGADRIEGIPRSHNPGGFQ